MSENKVTVLGDTPESRTPAQIKRQPMVVENLIPVLDTAKFEHMSRIAAAMSRASVLPSALKGRAPGEAEANCFWVINQAVRWNMDPFGLAPYAFVVHGRLGFEGKVIAAVLNTSGVLDGDLDYIYSGDKGTAGRKVVVRGTLAGTGEVKEVDGTVAEWATENENWKKSPDQMLAYRGAREWARRWKPQILLGVYGEDELNQIALTSAPPPRPTLADRRAGDAIEVPAQESEAEASQDTGTGFSHTVTGWDGKSVEYDHPDAAVDALTIALDDAPTYPALQATWEESHAMDLIGLCGKMGLADLVTQLNDAYQGNVDRLRREQLAKQAEEQKAKEEAEAAATAKAAEAAAPAKAEADSTKKQEAANPEAKTETAAPDPAEKAPAVSFAIPMPVTKSGAPDEMRWRSAIMAALRKAQSIQEVDAIAEHANAQIETHRLNSVTKSRIEERAEERRKALQG